jgi:hypothetical protein
MSDIVVRGESLPVSQAEVDESWGGIGQDDLVLPVVNLVQATSKVGTAGMFRYSTGQEIGEIKACLIHVSKRRILFGRDGDRGLCASDNSTVPSTRIEKPFSTNCMVCPMADWDPNPEKLGLAERLGKKGVENKPLCSLSYSNIFVDGDGRPFLMDFRGVMYKQAQQELYTKLRYEFGKLPMYGVWFTMKGEKEAKPGKVFYKIKFSKFEKMSAEEMAHIRTMYENTKRSAERKVSEVYEKMDAEKPKTQAQSRKEIEDGVPWPTEAPADFAETDDIPF